MARTKTKSGSKVRVICPVCGQEMTKAGLVGHMGWKHGRDHKAPMLPRDVVKDSLVRAIAWMSNAEYALRLRYGDPEDLQVQAKSWEQFDPIWDALIALFDKLGYPHGEMDDRLQSELDKIPSPDEDAS